MPVIPVAGHRLEYEWIGARAGDGPTLVVVLPALLDAFSIRRPLLIGHSDGGSIALIYEGSRTGQSAGLILEAPHVFVEDLTVKSIARIQALYENSDLRSRLARHPGERADPLFRAWTGVWLSPEFRSW
jgi:pimeloyl-ACP methyl ester carboxylesterase